MVNEIHEKDVRYIHVHVHVHVLHKRQGIFAFAPKTTSPTVLFQSPFRNEQYGFMQTVWVNNYVFDFPILMS